MNKAITDGVVFMPPPFANGLDVWSSGDGTPGSPTYQGAGPGIFVVADQNFDGCLEVIKIDNIQKVRHMGETPIFPGCYLRVTARVKVVGGPLPSVRIAGWAGRSGGNHVTGVTETGPATQLTAFGEVVEISAIVGTGARQGVDMVWPSALYGHFGIDIIGPNSSIVRVDDIVIEDVTSVFLRDIMAFVDVRDYGALGDGSTDDSAAFEAADAAANGRTVNVPAGTYYLGSNVTLENRVSFEGTVVMPDDKVFVMQRNYDYNSYLLAFGDEELAFRKAFQALFAPSDHESLDLCGRRIAIFGQIDMQAAVGTTATFAQRRVIRNGQILAASTGDWDDTVVTSQATYSTFSSRTLSNVANIAAIERGMLVTGSGVGREVYVVSRNLAQNSVTLSQPLYDAAGTQNFTFRRFKYLLDFSGFDALSLFHFEDIEFQCQGYASAIMLPRDGVANQVRDCFFTRPKDRAITSIGSACQGLQIDDCQFLSDESNKTAQQRKSIVLNANNNDLKIRGNRVVHFKHFAVLAGSGNLIVGNHYFHGDGVIQGVRNGGVVLTLPNCQTVFTGNYIDNNFIEWTNEHDPTPALGAQFSFGGLTVTGNTFIVSNPASNFSWIVIKPYGPGHFVHGFAVTGNVFRTLNGNIDKVEKIDTTFADLNYARMRNIEFRGNAYTGINRETFNPASVVHSQNTLAKNWIIGTNDVLPFRGRPRFIESVVPEGRLLNGANNTNFDYFYTNGDYDPSNKTFRVVFSEQVTGTIRCMVRTDNPT
ncbi:glycosyl hydrolase family 28-related protein [Roseisalinus antarcticus]|uniref:Pectate lyase superfamily protein n=1 Tax=Roseisalinus antarcticus TaxID=254357 RepID=A0A1Y5SYZ0_9RHOB|nr:glycosyl hydrolase family 28-related protein [Roseisalinus antarcticus]SLN51906.1 Pectate lyase superfamily protein [Roseisalinus antarcticus]